MFLSNKNIEEILKKRNLIRSIFGTYDWAFKFLALSKIIFFSSENKYIKKYTSVGKKNIEERYENINLNCSYLVIRYSIFTILKTSGSLPTEWNIFCQHI